ncbi:MAG: hypothetical protein GH143_05770 [Calditrichaeota bacterium]|nr:hypothetical protein [Calditrichota bacterium]
MFRKVLIILFLLFSKSLAQSSVSAIFLLISPSPAMNGMGQLGAALPSQDIFSIYYNPANFPRMNGLSLTYSFEGKTPWLTSLASDMFIHYKAGLVGCQFDRQRLESSLGYYRTYLDLGDQIVMDEYGRQIGSFHSYMSADVVTFGIHKNFSLGSVPLSLSLGGGVKSAIQVLSAHTPGRSEDMFYDMGLMMTLPVLLTYSSFPVTLNVLPAVGYSVLNLGGEIEFFEGQSDPPPTTARLGFSLSLSLIDVKHDLSLVSWRYGREVEDVLIVWRGEWEARDWYVDAPLGDINVFRHLIQGKEGEEVTLHKGEEVTLLGFYSLRVGEYVDLYGRLEFHTQGKSFYAHPVFQVLHLLFPSSLTGTLARHVDLSYSHSIENGGMRDGTRYQNVTLTLNHLGELITKVWPK